MFLSPLVERLGEGVQHKDCLLHQPPHPNLSPKGERSPSFLKEIECACSPPPSPPRPTPSRPCRPASRATANRCSSAPASIQRTRRACARRRCSSAGRAPQRKASS